MTMDFTNEQIQEVWNKAQKVEGFDDSLFRKDACGAWIARDKYGMRDNSFGWQIDHIYPVVKGGGDELFNLRAMQWQNNESKSDDYPSYIAMVKAEGNKNVLNRRSMMINKDVQTELNKMYNKDE